MQRKYPLDSMLFKRFEEEIKKVIEEYFRNLFLQSVFIKLIYSEKATFFLKSPHFFTLPNSKLKESWDIFKNLCGLLIIYEPSEFGVQMFV